MPLIPKVVETRSGETPPGPPHRLESAQRIRDKLGKPVFIDGAWILPLIQGGKGISVTNGRNAGAWAAENTGGTISGTGAAIGYDENGRPRFYPYTGRSRLERHEEMVAWSIKGAVFQTGIAHKASKACGGRGRIRMNFLKEAGGSMRIARGVLAGTRLPGGGNKIHAITMGAGLPTEDDAQMCADEGVYLDPIISGVVALNVLLKRAFKKWQGIYHELIGAVVYEDPWLAGGHNGITGREDPDRPEDPYERVKAIRRIMNQNGMDNVAIVMAGGVWYLRDWEGWLDNPDIGPIAFQFGTRDLLTQECPITDEWKLLLLAMKEGDVALNTFSPTGFYSSAYRNSLIRDLYRRSERQTPFARQPDKNLSERVEGRAAANKNYFVSPQDKVRADAWIAAGFETALRTPDNTLVFVSRDQAREIRRYNRECSGCLANCRHSAWSQDAEKNHSTGRLADPRTYCIQKVLMGAIQGVDLDHKLIFAGHNAYQAGDDPFYRDETGGVFIPTVKQLIERLLTGD